jgi:ABC-2 type transport system ATP-binding protein
VNELSAKLAIDVEGLNKHYGDNHVVQDAAIQVKEGHVCGFLGPNGSGKTTTLRMLCGLLTPDSGRGTCLGRDIITESAAIKLQTGYMPQKFSLYDELTIAENLRFFARIRCLDRKPERIASALERLGLQHRRNQRAGELSGGWKQRLALASSILHEPKLLLLDEPTAGVDPEARRHFWEQIHILAGEGVTVLVSTHYMDEAVRCHEIAYIVYGKLKARGTADEVVAASGLITFEGEGEGEGARADLLCRELGEMPGVQMAAPFGKAIHVCGTDRRALEAAIAPYRGEPYRWREVEASLEDVFIHLMDTAKDNYQ